MALVEFQNNSAPYLNAENLNHNFNELKNGFGDVKLKSFNNVTNNIKITSVNGYGSLLLISAGIFCLIQLNGANIIIHDVYETHGNMVATIDNNVLTLSGLYNWDHYILIGSFSSISSILAKPYSII